MWVGINLFDFAFLIDSVDGGHLYCFVVDNCGRIMCQKFWIRIFMRNMITNLVAKLILSKVL